MLFLTNERDPTQGCRLQKDQARALQGTLIAVVSPGLVLVSTSTRSTHLHDRKIYGSPSSLELRFAAHSSSVHRSLLEATAVHR